MEEKEVVTLEEVIRELSEGMSEDGIHTQVTAIQNMLSRGVPLKDSLNISDDVLEFLYNQGFQNYNIQKYDDALKNFHLLFMLHPQNSRYSFGIAACYQKLKNFEQAIIWYLVLSFIDNASPLPFYYLSNCFFQTGDFLSELYYLKKALGLAEREPQYAQLKERLTRMIEKLEHEKKAKEKK